MHPYFYSDTGWHNALLTATYYIKIKLTKIRCVAFRVERKYASFADNVLFVLLQHAGDDDNKHLVAATYSL